MTAIACGQAETFDAPDASAVSDAGAHLRGRLALDHVLRFAVIGDYGCGNLTNYECAPGGEAAGASVVAALAPDAIISLGDDNYGPLTFGGYSAVVGHYYGAYIKGTFPFMAGLAHPNRFWPAPGNHDWYVPHDRNDDVYRDYFSEALGTTAHHWDADLGPVHLFSLDTGYSEADQHGTPAETALNRDLQDVAGSQAQWLRAALASSRSCFNVVLFHFAPFSSGFFAVPTMRWPFRAWGADVVLSGHEHFYERLRDTDGMTYFISGAAGGNLFGFRSPPDPRSQFRWGALSDGTKNLDRHGALLMTADTVGDPLPGRLEFEFHTAGGLVLDRFTIERDCSLPHSTAEPVDLGTSD